jgi:hypothetical protein
VIWMSWRQQRVEAAMTAGLLALVAILLVPVGLHMASVFTHSGTAACLAHTAANGSGCDGIVSDFSRRFEHALPIIPWLNFLPGLFGVLFAAPLVLELEHGTFRLTWTQSITRRRWLTTKLAVIYASALLATVALSILLTWWRHPLDALQGRMGQNVFDFEGIVPYAYTVFAVSLVIVLGAFTRRTITATGGALLAYFGLRISVQTWLRQNYLAPIKHIWKPGTNGPNLNGAWNIFIGPSDAHGHVVPNAGQIISTCMNLPKQEDQRCLNTHHVFNLAIYQPASRFWLFQGIEAAIFAGLGVMFLAAALLWIRQRVG